MASLNDPELQQGRAAKERERLHLAYCRGEMQWKEKAFKPDRRRQPQSLWPVPGMLGNATTSINK